MERLKRCPFCGSVPTLHKDTWPTPTGKAVAYWVKCSPCGASSNEYKTEDAAAAAWNKRTTDGKKDNY